MVVLDDNPKCVNDAYMICMLILDQSNTCMDQNECLFDDQIFRILQVTACL